MADDLINLRLSKRASLIAESLYERGYFDDRVSVVKIGFAYAIEKYYGRFDPIELADSLDSEGYNYNVGSLDGDKSIAELIRNLYPDTTAPYRIARGIICFGLERLGELSERGELFPIYELL